MDAHFSGPDTNAPTGTGFVSISARGDLSLALRSDGTIVVWFHPEGSDDGGVAASTPTGNDFVAAAVGQRHAVAVRSDGSLVSWGENSYGVVSTTPNGSDFTAVAAGFFHSVALRSDGSLVSWGYDGEGEVSDTPAGGGFIAAAAGFGLGAAIAGPSPAGETQTLGAAVQAIIDGGADLGGNRGGSLTAPLARAAELLAGGHTEGAEAQLAIFVRRVEEHVEDGNLTSAQGDDLIAAAQAILDEIDG